MARNEHATAEGATWSFKVYEPPVKFQRGDVDGSGDVTIGDPVGILLHLFIAGVEHPPCLDALDVNDDGQVAIGDAVAELDWLFRGGPPPAPPGVASCGNDPTADIGGDLGCETPESCVN